MLRGDGKTISNVLCLCPCGVPAWMPFPLYNVLIYMSSKIDPYCRCILVVAAPNEPHCVLCENSTNSGQGLGEVV